LESQSSAPSQKRWWNLSVFKTAQSLQTDPEKGLNSRETKRRLEQYGANQLPEKAKFSVFRLFLHQFSSFIIWVLVAAAAIAGILGEWLDAAAILAIVVLNALLGFVQEFRAERSLAALRKLSVPACRVVRDGELRIVPSPEIVPGELVFLEAGDRIPADGRIIRSTQLRTQEASLTGESTPVDKTAEALRGAETALGDRTNMAFMGTVVVKGKGKMIVTETGLATELGKIAAILQRPKEEKTPLESNLDQAGRRLVALFLFIVGGVFGLGLLRGNPLMEMLLTALSLAVAAIPEGLPAVVTVTLALGVHKMARRNALIRRLASVETLGCATVICSDKTGTLTENEMTVQRIWANGRWIGVTGVGYAPQGGFREGGETVDPAREPELMEALKIGVLCNSATLKTSNGGWEIVGDPTEGAVLTAARKAGLVKESLEAENPLLGEIPFDSDRKRMSVLRKTPEGPRLLIMGAPDLLLERSDKIFLQGAEADLSPERKLRVEEAHRELAQLAFRILGVAFRPVPDPPPPLDESLEEKLTFVGLIAMMDPPRPEARLSIGTCEAAGIRPVMITGDHKETAVAIARELGLSKEGSLALSGTELDSVGDEELERIVERVSVYARVSAEHKLRVVRAWKKKGEVVAVTGDGINDAPAVKEANIGVAMGITGTDVTKEASDMVITDDNFASIVNAVEEGRGIYDNIVKFIKFLLSYNIAEILVILVAILVGLRDSEGKAFIPLTAVQILWMNLVTDGLPAIALGVDPLAPGAMARPPRRPAESIFNRRFFLHMGVISVLAAIASLVACGWGLHRGTEAARTMTLTTLVMLELMGAQMVRSIYGLSFFSNRWLLAALASSWVLQLCILYVPGLQSVFQVAPLGPQEWAVILGIGLAVWGISWSVNKGLRRFFISA
jgi:Ca2+-transporting ATPase